MPPHSPYDSSTPSTPGHRAAWPLSCTTGVLEQCICAGACLSLQDMAHDGARVQASKGQAA